MPECLCGCGAHPRRPDSRFMPGHNANSVRRDRRSIAYRTGIIHARWGVDAVSDNPDYLYGYEKEKAYV